jgi:hypothetical protein
LKEDILKICDFLIGVNQNEFKQKVLLMKGRKRPYFSINPNELRVPVQIKKSGIFVETNLSANYIVKLSETLAALFSYNADLQIEYK